MGEESEQPSHKIQININPEVARGAYSNAAEIKHSKEEFCIDFFNVFPPVGAMVARVIVSPGHLKRMISALKDNLDKHERQYGPVHEADEPSLFRPGPQNGAPAA